MVHCTAIEIWDHGVFAAAGIERWSTEDDRGCNSGSNWLGGKVRADCKLKKVRPSHPLWCRNQGGTRSRQP